MPFSKFVFLMFLALALIGCGKQSGAPSPGSTSGVQAAESPNAKQATQTDAPGVGTTESVTQAASDAEVPSFEAKPTELVVDRDGARKSVAQAETDSATGNYEKAARAYSDAMMLDPQNAEIPYKSARNFAVWGKNDLAIESLGVAADLGYSDAQTVSSQSDFEPLRENPRFAKIVGRMESNR